MIKLLLTPVFIISAISFSQTMIGNFKIDGAGIYYSRENYMQGTLSSNQFVKYTSTDFFYFQDSSIVETDENFVCSKRSIGTEISLKKPDSKYRFIFGLQLSKGLNATYNFIDQENTYIDTVEETVVVLEQIHSDGSYSYQYITDELVVDSLVIEKEESISRSGDIIVHSEFLYDRYNSHFRLSMGIGAATGISIYHDVSTRYKKEWSLQKIKDYGDGEETIYWVFQPLLMNPNGPPEDKTLAPINDIYHSEKGKLIFYFRPYIPLRLETHVADSGIFSKLGIMACASAGLSLQIVQEAGISSRFFWSFKGGLFYKF